MDLVRRSWHEEEELAEEKLETKLNVVRKDPPRDLHSAR